MKTADLQYESFATNPDLCVAKHWMANGYCLSIARARNFPGLIALRARFEVALLHRGELLDLSHRWKVCCSKHLQLVLDALAQLPRYEDDPTRP